MNTKMGKKGLTYHEACEKFGKDEFGRSNVRKIFEIRIGDKNYQVYSIEGYSHLLGKYNGQPETWWLDWSDYEETTNQFGEVEAPIIRELIPYIDNGVHRVCWGIHYSQFNSTKYKWDEWDIRSGGKCTISANGKEVYKFFYREMKGALAHAQVKIDEMLDHPYNFLNPEEEEGRKIWYYGLPAKILLGYETGEIRIQPDFEYMTQNDWWDELEKRRTNVYPKKRVFVDDEESMEELDKEHFAEHRDYGSINHGSAFYDGMINWFRK